MKMPQYAKPVSIIFILAVGAAVAAYVGFGLYGPSQYLVPPPEVTVQPAVEVPAPTAPIFAISILKGSSTQGNPDFDPDIAQVPAGNIIEWTNNDDVAHTVTSSADAGATFDSGLLSAGAIFRVDTSKLNPGTYEYMCIVHPWMTASFIVGGGGAPAAPQFPISILKDSQTQGNPDYDPDAAKVPAGSIIVWTNNDSVAHTVTSSADAGATFDSSLISAGATFSLDTAKLSESKYDYMCVVHPWMQASFEIVQSAEPAAEEKIAEGATAVEPNAVISEPAETPTEAAPAETAPEQAAPTEQVVPQATPEASVEEPSTEPVAQNTVSLPQGSSTPGCETTNACYVPYSIKVPVGTTVTWTNDDSAAHTVTSGKESTPDGVFDSSLFLSGKTFSFTFEEAGEYQYFCMVHPWMKGLVTVE
jgi:plastocyanin